MVVYVLDGGASEEKKHIMERVDSETTNEVTIRCIARENVPGFPHHAKARNIDNVLFNRDTNE